MLIIFRCTVRHNFEPVRLVPGALFNTQPLVHGLNPSTTNFLAVWRWTLAVGEVHGESILVLVFACFGRFCAKC